MISMFRTLCASFLALASTCLIGQPVAAQNFLVLPFAEADVQQTQGPLYFDGSVHTFGLPFDYYRNVNGTNVAFEVRAAADGVAMWACQDEMDCDHTGFGMFVLIKHEVSPYFTLYGHLGTIGAGIPKRDKRDVVYSTWKPVKAGDVIGTAGNTGWTECQNKPCNQVHFEVFRGGYAQGPVDPYDLSTFVSNTSTIGRLTQANYYPNTTPGCGPNYLWTVCPPVHAPNTGGQPITVQPGPAQSKDIWTTSVFSYTGAGGGPGGGLDNEELRVGGWGDLYYSLLEFDISGLPPVASSARIELFHFGSSDSRHSSVGMYLDRITEAWDWRTGGTGSDNLRLWWADRPNSVSWTADQPQPMPAPAIDQWYSIDITNLYNAWQASGNGRDCQESCAGGVLIIR